jgi:hypothetical protein
MWLMRVVQASVCGPFRLGPFVTIVDLPGANDTNPLISERVQSFQGRLDAVILAGVHPDNGFLSNADASSRWPSLISDGALKRFSLLLLKADTMTPDPKIKDVPKPERWLQMRSRVQNELVTKLFSAVKSALEVRTLLTRL